MQHTEFLSKEITKMGVFLLKKMAFLILKYSKDFIHRTHFIGAISRGEKKPCISDGQPEHCPSSESEGCVKFMSIYIVTDICLQIFGTGPLIVCWING